MIFEKQPYSFRPYLFLSLTIEIPTVTQKQHLKEFFSVIFIGFVLKLYLLSYTNSTRT